MKHLLQPIVYITSCSLICFFAFICNKTMPIEYRHIIETISAEDLRQRIDTAPKLHDPAASPLIVVNVLGPRCYKDCHIPHSLHAPLATLTETAKEWIASSWHTTKTFVVYCALNSCDASEKAYTILKNMGFANVIAYEGGIREWKLLGYPTTGPCDLDYLQLDFVENKYQCTCESICTEQQDAISE